MSCKSLLYAAQTIQNAVAANGTVNFGLPIRRFGQSIRMSGTGISLLTTGYYTVDVNLTVQPTADSAITAQLNENGTPVTGAEVTATPTAAAADTVLTIPAGVVRVTCDGFKNLTVTLDAAATVVNAAITVQKV